ncbi:hypothetical protein [Streptomyces lancefieldiae]|uniref:Uncharacterized protein n=1 Tax=Streptomyces lancefieldiae TaxID=3075520 RepID=A0ABU3B0Z0_9ACTN|nr:hypothetical protein [Streptomyces sp. DSM 40712]MDT0615780.1 hypothetical protein [Streptomyces sp. DSM 40712]
MTGGPAQAAVFAAPPARDEQTRVRGAHAAAARNLQVTASGPEVRGRQGRTLSRQAGSCWIAHRNLPAPLIPLCLGTWTVITLAAAGHLNLPPDHHLEETPSS